jgi:protein-export SecD/SecF family membrane protein
MKTKSVFILLFTVVVACGLLALSYLGVGTVPTTTDSSESGQQIELETATNADGEVELVTDAEGSPVTKVVEATTEEGSTEATTKAPGYASYKNIKQGLDLKGGVYIVYQADKDAPTDDEMSAAVSMLQERVVYMGYNDAEVSKEGDNRIRVQIPGVDDAAATAEEIGEAAHLTFRDEDGNVLVDGANVKNAGKAYQNNEVVVTLEFDSEGKDLFAEATKANLNKRIGIYMDEILLSNPTVNSAITDGSAVITGDFDADSAEALAAKIRAGSLPFSLNVINYNQVGARLGANSLSTSVKAGLIGIALVLLFMLIVYRVPGFVADVALVVYMGLVLVLLSLFQITLTLPGVAGIILSVGMAVDANVIIFERTKEEIRMGKSAKVAVRNGFAKAFSAILDGNVTTLITCAVLLWLGTGPIKGFAQTLALGIVISMFTALVVTRFVLYALIELGVNNPKLYGGK